MTLPLRLLLFYINNFKKKVDLDRISPAEVRTANRLELKKLGTLVDQPPCNMREVVNKTFSARDKTEIPYRCYLPERIRHEGAILFFHGGGFVLRDLDSHDSACRRIAMNTERPVFSIAYRLAPEHKFPGPVQDCEDAFEWLHANAATFGIDPERIVIIGDSAGANLATVVSLLRKRKGLPSPWRQVLIYPTVDASMSFPSIDTLGTGYFLTRESIAWFVRHYQSRPEDIHNPLMSPILADDLAGLPPTYLCTAEFDPLLDEGFAFAEKLRAQDVEVTYRMFRGVIHGFLNLRRLCLRQNQEMHDDIVDFLS